MGQTDKGGFVLKRAKTWPLAIGLLLGTDFFGSALRGAAAACALATGCAPPLRTLTPPTHERGSASARVQGHAAAGPVSPNPSPEAIDLLQFLRDISGKQTLTGQHCAPLVGSTRLAAVYKVVGQYPALFGQDFGFSEPGTWDGINFRQQIVDEAIRRHHEGFVIALMWHAVRPTEDEPVKFETSIQGKLTDQEWQDLITPGTPIHERWKSQVDVIAWHLKQLRNAGVPVLWRPYHEMNGGWFWWGKRPGDAGFKKLYRMLFDRLVQFHGLNNLLWVFGANQLGPSVDAYETYYPGDDVVDVLATDVYHGFEGADYERLSLLARGRPIALAEVGPPPTVELLEKQPRWTYFMSWNDPMSESATGETLRAIYECDHTLTLQELPWVRPGKLRVHYPILD